MSYCYCDYVYVIEILQDCGFWIGCFCLFGDFVSVLLDYVQKFIWVFVDFGWVMQVEVEINVEEVVYVVIDVIYGVIMCQMVEF